MSEDREYKSLVTEGLIVAVFTLLCYVSAYGFESSYSSYWEVPAEFIVISFASIFRSGMYVLSVLGVLTIFYYTMMILHIKIISKNLVEKDGPLSIVIGINVILLLICLIIAASWGLFVGLAAIVFTLGFYNGFGVVAPFISDKRRHDDCISIEERINRSQIDISKNNAFGAVKELFSNNQTIKVGLLILILAAAVFFVSSAIGVKVAKEQSIFMVDEVNNRVLIRGYDGYFFLRSLDEENSLFKNELYIQSLEEVKKVKFTNKKLNSYKLDEKVLLGE